MKVCFVLSHFYPHVGGAESALMGLIRELIKKNIEVRVLTCKDNGDKKYIKYEGIDIYYYDWKIMFGHPLVRACDIVEHVKWADVVHSAVYSPVITVNRVCKKLNKPHVCTVYEVLGKKWYWIESNKIKALMFKMYESLIVHCKCDIFVTDSLATQRDLLKCNKKANTTNIYWVSDGEEKNIKIDKEKFRKYFGLSKNDVVFLNYGRPGKTKGLFIYLEAIRKVFSKLGAEKLKNKKFCFLMGNDPISERNRFIEMLKKYNLEDNVIVKESVSREDLANYRECADYIVVPSITEGFGLTAIEACEVGKKVIHSSAGSLPEVTFGEVVEFENRNYDDLADKLEKIIIGELKFNEKEKKDFSGDTISNQFIAVYKEMIGNKVK